MLGTKSNESHTIKAIRGARIPSPGFGTFDLQGDECRRVVEKALELGYRHFDTAESYENEEEVGRALLASDLNRWDVFVTSKVSPRHYGKGDFRQAVEASLKRLKTDSLDLLLLHWPAFHQATLPSAIEALNTVHDEGLTRHIGVSNFTSRHLQEAVSSSSAPVVVNQVEYHPYLDQDVLLSTMEELGVALAAYCPVARGRTAKDPVLQDIGSRHGKSGAQVALRWLVQQGVVPLPRSSDPVHAAENLDLFGFRLSDEEMLRIRGLKDPDGRIIDPDENAPEWD